MIKAIILDFDGLILDTEYPEYISWRDVYQSMGFDLTIEAWVPTIGLGASAISTTPYDDLEEKLGRPIDRAAVRAKRRARFSELMQLESILPGVQSLLDEARATDILLGIASSSPKTWVVGYLEQLGITHYFDVIKCGDEVDHTKPDPELYLSALRAFHLNADQALALEDSPHGIAAAKAAGLYCIAVPNTLTRYTSLAQADVIVENLEKLSLAEILHMVSKD